MIILPVGILSGFPTIRHVRDVLASPDAVASAFLARCHLLARCQSRDLRPAMIILPVGILSGFPTIRLLPSEH
ncbi:hypothetical protein BM1_08311 [Bipolaris maydis]|nr:hypothetical protein BM1_08311 [Bipolaris maydis]